MKSDILVRDYLLEDVEAIAHIYFNTIHQINVKDYTKEQVDVWAPKSSLEVDGWLKKCSKTNPIVAISDNIIVGFAEFLPNGYIDCFYVHHEWIGKGVGKRLMNEIFHRAEKQQIHRIFVEVSITAKPFFEKQGFKVIKEQSVEKRGVKLTNYQMEKMI